MIKNKKIKQPWVTGPDTIDLPGIMLGRYEELRDEGRVVRRLVLAWVRKLYCPPRHYIVDLCIFQLTRWELYRALYQYPEKRPVRIDTLQQLKMLCPKCHQRTGARYLVGEAVSYDLYSKPTFLKNWNAGKCLTCMRQTLITNYFH